MYIKKWLHFSEWNMIHMSQAYLNSHSYPTNRNMERFILTNQVQGWCRFINLCCLVWTLNSGWLSLSHVSNYNQGWNELLTPPCIEMLQSWLHDYSYSWFIWTYLCKYIYKIYRYHYLSKNEDMMFGKQIISWQLPYFNQGKYNIFLF